MPHLTTNTILNSLILLFQRTQRLLAVKGAGPLKVGGAIHSNRVLTISQSVRVIFMARLHSALLCHTFCSRSEAIFLESSSNKLPLRAPSEAETSSSRHLPLQSVTHLFVTSSAPVYQKAVCAPVWMRRAEAMFTKTDIIV